VEEGPPPWIQPRTPSIDKTAILRHTRAESNKGVCQMIPKDYRETPLANQFSGLERIPCSLFLLPFSIISVIFM